MKAIIGVLSLICIVSAGCSTKKTQLDASDSHTLISDKAPVDISVLDKTIERLKTEIAVLETLEMKVYAKSLKADPKAKKELEKRILQYGSLETLQASLRMLKQMKSEVQSSQDLKTASN